MHLPCQPVLVEKVYFVDSQAKISGRMKIEATSVLRAIESKCQKQFTSDEFPSIKANGGLRCEIRFFPSDFSNAESASLYIHVVKNDLQGNSLLRIPPMDVAVTLYRCKEEMDDHCSKEMIKSTNIKTMAIDDHAKSAILVASLPQLISHKELGLSGAEGEHLLICVDINLN